MLSDFETAARTLLAVRRSIEVVVVGASAGAVRALGEILPRLPASMRVPFVVVVHVPPRRESLLPALFSAKCVVPVREPSDKEPLGTDTVWIAPPDYHLLVERSRVFSLSIEAPVLFSRPSIDVSFESAADAFGANVCAVVLSGSNDDGAAGARRIRKAGGWVVVQDPSEAESREMPTAAIRDANPQIVLGLEGIASLLRDLVEGGR